MNTFTASPAGGCVTVAVIRHEPSEASIAAESMVVLGNATLVRLSHGRRVRNQILRTNLRRRSEAPASRPLGVKDRHQEEKRRTRVPHNATQNIA